MQSLSFDWFCIVVLWFILLKGLMFMHMAKRMNNDREATLRNCKFPSCGIEFMGIGKTKYCDEHRKASYRSELYGRKPGETAVFDNDGNWVPIHEINQTIKHTHCIATDIECTCALEGCKEPFRVLLLPNIYTYPCYCPDHRSEFRRNFYISQQEKLYGSS